MSVIQESNTDITNIAKRLSILEAMEIPVWIQRPKSPLFFPEAKVYTSVLVLLSKQISKTETALYNTLQGMLKVLNISEDAYCFAWIKKDTKNNDLNLDTPMLNVLMQEVTGLKPKNILIMGKNLGERCQTLHIPGYNPENIFVTYHPEALQDNMTYKKEAYQTLLQLKQVLHEGVVLK